MHTGNKRLLWQRLTTMVIDKIRKMSVKGVKLKSESYFLLSPGVLELWRKTLGGRIPPPPPVQIGLRKRPIRQANLFLLHRDQSAHPLRFCIRQTQFMNLSNQVVTKNLQDGID